MKRLIKIVLYSVCLLLVLEGCFVSAIHPLWDITTRKFDERLAGEWYDPDDSTSSYRLEPLSDTAYLFTIRYTETITSEDTLMVNQYLATLVKLGKFNFLDLYPWDEDDNLIFNRFNENFIPVHTFSKIEYDDQVLQIFPLDGEHLETLLEKNRIRLKHETLGDFTLLTASTKELQGFMKRYADDPEAFDAPGILRRK